MSCCVPAKIQFYEQPMKSISLVTIKIMVVSNYHNLVPLSIQIEGHSIKLPLISFTEVCFLGHRAIRLVRAAELTLPMDNHIVIYPLTTFLSA